MSRARAKMTALLIRTAIAAVLLGGLITTGSAKASAGQHYPKQQPISHALPAALGSIACQSLPAGSADDYLTCAYTGFDDAAMAFYLFVPQNYDPTQSYPLTLILHGSGERSLGANTAAQNRAAVLNNQYVAVWGPGAPIDGPSVQETYPSFVVVPQIPLDDSWVDATLAYGNYGLSQQPTTDLATAMVIVELVQQTYAGIDANRRYITGISMGAFGVWDAIERWPDYFAAAVPVAGGGSPALATLLKTTPVWAFHGAADISVPPAASTQMVLAMRAAGGHACYTLYPGAQHAIWDTVFGLANNANNRLYPWLFAQNNAKSSPSAMTC